jgi:hypothetical protein
LQLLPPVMEQLRQEELLGAALLVRLDVLLRERPGPAAAHRQACGTYMGRKHRQCNLWGHQANPAAHLQWQLTRVANIWLQIYKLHLHPHLLGQRLLQAPCSAALPVQHCHPEQELLHEGTALLVWPHVMHIPELLMLPSDDQGFDGLNKRHL